MSEPRTRWLVREEKTAKGSRYYLRQENTGALYRGEGGGVSYWMDRVLALKKAKSLNAPPKPPGPVIHWVKRRLEADPDDFDPIDRSWP